MTENEILYLLRGCINRVYDHFGPGLLESAYILALSQEINECGLSVQTEIPIPLVYKDIKLKHGYRLDILVNNKVIIDVKSVETLQEVHHKQIITYLKLSGLKLALLVNFNVADMAKGIFRKVNGLKRLIFLLCIEQGPASQFLQAALLRDLREMYSSLLPRRQDHSHHRQSHDTIACVDKEQLE